MLQNLEIIIISIQLTKVEWQVQILIYCYNLRICYVPLKSQTLCRQLDSRWSPIKVKNENCLGFYRMESFTAFSVWVRLKPNELSREKRCWWWEWLHRNATNPRIRYRWGAIPYWPSRDMFRPHQFSSWRSQRILNHIPKRLKKLENEIKIVWPPLNWINDNRISHLELSDIDGQL